MELDWELMDMAFVNELQELDQRFFFGILCEDYQQKTFWSFDLFVRY